MDNFEEKYGIYIKKNKKHLSRILKENYRKFEYEFEYDFIKRDSSRDIIKILWLVFGFVTIPLLEKELIWYIIVFVVWVGIGILYWKYSHEDTKAIANYFFKTYQYHIVIENFVREEEQREIQTLLNEMFDKDNLNFADLDMYKFKLEDIEYFYSECLNRLKHEDFEL
jgi:hypothetical protein